jgi:uncharacterized protein
MIRKEFVTQLRSIDEKNRTLTLVASTEAVDRYGDIIRVKGWKLDNYLKNPVFLWQHGSSDPPIGRSVRVWTESSPAALVHDVKFAGKEEYPFADTIYKLYKGGYLRATSVGFMPLEEPEAITDESGRMTGQEFSSQELLELSAVTVPANPEALGRAATDAAVESILRELFEVPRDENIEQLMRDLDDIGAPVATLARAFCK